MANNDLELKIEEQSKVKAMIEGINQSNMKNIESFEEQIQQRNVTINSLRSENDELKSKVSKSAQDLRTVKEQSERYREEAEQLAESSVFEAQVGCSLETKFFEFDMSDKVLINFRTVAFNLTL